MFSKGVVLHLSSNFNDSTMDHMPVMKMAHEESDPGENVILT